jgi:hypothetical protein
MPPLYFAFSLAPSVELTVPCGAIKMKIEADGSQLLTLEQKQWIEAMKIMLTAGPLRRLPRPKGSRFRGKVHDVVASKNFELFVLVLILSNALVMSTRHLNQTPGWDTLDDTSGLVFTILFIIEALAKMVGYTPAVYFSVAWNRFDFTIIVVGVLGQSLSFYGSAGLSQYAVLMRVLRVVRIFRLVKTSKGLKLMFKTILFALPSLANVGSLFLLNMYIFAAIGMNLFSQIKVRFRS